ncbi:MAG TPA: FimV/HubP family polar landmark protein [Candidimonas sp.]|nr:FimV/HubP family polar landmark protein [Candidimonas sp.]
MSRLVSPSVALVFNTKPWVGALAAALLIGSSAHAANFGHSRIVSKLGQPLRIDIPVTELSADDLRSISVVPAPASAWTQIGLTPPVDIGSLQATLADGFTAGTKVIQVRSNQAFDKPVADLLLDVRTASGQQRFQVSLLTQAGQATLQPALAQPQGGASKAGASTATAGVRASQGTITVRRNDNMFAIAKRHAVPGVTVYQMMIALQRANPQAFIEDNVNLVKAGATLSMPDMAALTAISDSEARRIFQRQSQAFALYRQRAAGHASVVGKEGAAAKGLLSSEGAPAAQQPAAGPRDQLRLSGGEPVKGGGAGSAQGSATAPGAGAAGGSSSADVHADNRVATEKGIKDSEARVSQLEENVKHLNEALQAQGAAASGLLVDGAKGLGLSLPGTAGSANDANTANTADGVNNSSSATNSNTANTNGQAAGGAAQPSAGSAAAVGGNAGAKAGSGADGAPAGSSSATPNTAAPGSAAANNQTNDAASKGTNGAGSVEQPISSKAEQTVSWIQEHMLGVITGLLALIVLIIAWILRRANTAHNDVDRPGPVTEAMVKEKLDQINLDLEQAPSEPVSRKG